MLDSRPIPLAPCFDADAAVRRATAAIAAHDEHDDAAGRFPQESIVLLAETGLLIAPFPPAAGGSALGDAPETLAMVLAALGQASQSVGRLYENHFHAVTLVARHGDAALLAELAGEARAGRLSGLWQAPADTGVRATRTDGGWRLDGRMTACPGAGSIRRPVVAAMHAPGEPLLLLMPDMDHAGATVEPACQRAAGLRASAAGAVTFDRVFVGDAQVLGGGGRPEPAAGGWRVLAVQLGALERIAALHADFLNKSGRAREPVLRARFADAAADVELARLLVASTAVRAEDRHAEADERETYVNMARTAFERLGHGVIAAARRNVGMASFIAPNPIERVVRDLEAWLRQPFLDAARDAHARHLLDPGGRC